MSFKTLSLFYWILLSSISLSCQTDLNSSETATTNPLTETTDSLESSEPIIEDSIHRIKLVFVGDIMGHQDQINSAWDPVSKTHDYEPCFRYISPILERADLAIGNLELTLNDKPHYTGYPRFRSPDALAYALKNAGFDVLVTSNNHSNDNDRYGIVHTLDVLDSLSFFHTGTFRDSIERQNTYPLIVEKEVDGTTFRLAFLNYTYGTNGIPTIKPSIVNEIDKKQMAIDIQKAKDSNPDMIIAFMHWGAEYQLNEGVEQRDQCQFLWDNGVDLVVGAHPHTVQPIKTASFFNADSSEQRNVIVAYSLGNFISNQFNKNTEVGLMFEIELVKNSKSNKTVLGEHDYIPVWRYIYNYQKVPTHDWVHTIVPVAAFESDTTNFLKMPKAVFSQMISHTDFIRKNLAKWQSTERKPSFEEIVSKARLSPDKTSVALEGASSN